MKVSGYTLGSQIVENAPQSLCSGSSLSSSFFQLSLISILNALTLFGYAILFIVRSLSGRQFFFKLVCFVPRCNCFIFLVVFKISLAHIRVQLVLFRIFNSKDIVLLHVILDNFVGPYVACFFFRNFNPKFIVVLFVVVRFHWPRYRPFYY
jgi:hypothetical protein